MLYLNGAASPLTLPRQESGVVQARWRMLVDEGVPIVMLSGMAADERLFAPQRARFPNLRVQPWIKPLPAESVQRYAARLAPQVDPGRPFIVGGASFGGVVALELAGLLPALACVLIGSIRSPAALPWRWRLLQPLAVFGPDALRSAATLGARIGGRFLPSRTVRQLHRFSQPGAMFLRWAACAVVQWRPSPAAKRVQVYQIHGAADRELPLGHGRLDTVVPAGGHALTLFSPTAVNEFLAKVVCEVAPKSTEAMSRMRKKGRSREKTDSNQPLHVTGLLSLHGHIESSVQHTNVVVSHCQCVGAPPHIGNVGHNLQKQTLSAQSAVGPSRSGTTGPARPTATRACSRPR